jgi:hypothetical protein
MTRIIAAALITLTLVAVAPAAQAQQKAAMPSSAIAESPEWQEMRSLVGQWEGFMETGGKQTPATVEVRLTGDGSALMHVMGKDTPYEMVTMIHPDGKRLLATHYCAAHNQPRMANVPAKAPNQVAFDFIDGTNIADGDARR